jgi:hypothetical protein
MLQLYCVCVVYTVKKMSPSEMKFFIRVIIAMAYVFNLFLVVTIVFNGGHCFYFKNGHHFE